MYVFFANGFSNIMDKKLFTISIGYNSYQWVVYEFLQQENND